MTDTGMTEQANTNRNALASIRSRMLRGELTHDQAKAEANPIIQAMNVRAKELAKEHGAKFYPIKFINIMR